MGYLVRQEKPGDSDAIRSLLIDAFETPAEADLLEALRVRRAILLSLVALEGNRIVGHVLFTPASIETPAGTIQAVALGPMAVLPGYQGQGIGRLLMHAGLEACRQDGHGVIVVLGHPEYYPRFGFQPASQFKIRSEFDVPDEAFMLLELQPGAAKKLSGTFHYQPEFNKV